MTISKWTTLTFGVALVLLIGYFFKGDDFIDLALGAAEVTIDDSVAALDAKTNSDSPRVVFINDTDGYIFFIDSTNVASYASTTDGGVNWGNTIALTAQTDVAQIAVWWDQWTPGDSGTDIHIVFSEESGDDIYYERLDTDDGSQLGEVAIAGFDLGGIDEDSPTSITKSTDGNLFAVMLEATNGDVWKSTSTGATWFVTNSPIVGDNDWETQLTCPIC